MIGRSPRLSGMSEEEQARFTPRVLDEYRLRGPLPTRATRYASYRVLVHRLVLVRLLHASSRRCLAATPLCFANPSPSSGWIGTYTPELSNMLGTKTRRADARRVYPAINRPKGRYNARKTLNRTATQGGRTSLLQLPRIGVKLS